MSTWRSTPVPGVHEAVRCIRGSDYDLARAHDPLLVARDEQCLALLHDEDLRVGMPVELRAATRWRLDEDDADACVVLLADQLAGEGAGRKLSKPDDSR